MWTLECEGPLFHNKRLWLRPGTSHLFGRMKQETLRNTESYVLDAKSVSKKHLKLSVSAVQAGHGSQLHARTEVIIEEFSKLGTTIDGDRISQTTKVLKGESHVLKVAKYEHALILRWQPVTFDIINLTRAEKQSTDPLSAYRAQLEGLDIKFSRDYVTGQTTHVVAQKRNLPAVLQGLIHGDYIVTKEYLDAVVKAATEEPSKDGGEPKAPLEKDFDGAWPDPMRFVPDVAGEPIKREASYLAPKSERADIFYGYTFVFCLKSQFDSLKAVVNAGSGKAILYEGFEAGRADPTDFVKFVKNAAGEKGAGELEERDKGVVVIRLTSTDKSTDASFVQESSRQLDLRFIEQNELLDTILTSDTTKLRQRLAEEIDLRSSAQPSQTMSTRATPASRAKPASTAKPKSEPATHVRSSGTRAKTESRFRGFDAFDDSDDDEPAPARAPAVTRSMPQIAEDVAMDDVEDAPASAPARSTRARANANSRKRPTPEPDHDIMDEILPAAAAMKRRKLNEGGPVQAKPPTPEKKPARKLKAEREIDVLAEVQKRREEEEARAREDAEKLKEAMDGMEIHGPANLVQVEEMVLSRSHSASVSRVSIASSDRWDPKWDGRPNFKRFRRKGEDRAVRTRQRNFVPMEETKRKDFGIGEEYWLESISKQKEKERSQRDTQMQSQTLRENTQRLRDNDEEEENTQFRRRPRTQRPSQVAEEDDDDVEIVEETVRSAENVSQQRSIGSAPKTTTRKRPAEKPPAKEPPAKKKAWKKVDSDEENEDEFAFPKSRRGATTRRR